MKVYVKNKFLSLSGSSKVLDEKQNPIYKVKGKWVVFSPTRKKKIYDMNNTLLYVVRNKWFNWFTHKAYIFDANKNKIACVTDKAFDVTEYVVEGYQDEIKIDGKFFSATSNIIKNGEVIGTISRKADWTDSFEIDADEKEIPFLVALVIALDNITDKRRHQKR